MMPIRKLKDAWDYAKDTWKYSKDMLKPRNITLTTMLTAAALFPKEAKAQSNPNDYKKPLTEIVQEGDNIIVPEQKFNEFLKNNKTEKNNTLTKPTGDYTKDGYITDALTQEPLEGIEAFLITYNPFPTDTTGPIITDFQGYYSLIITGINDQKEIKNIGQIEYFNGKARITTNNYKKIKITTYDILGQEIETLTNKEIQGTETIDLKLPIGETITKIEIDGKKYTNIHINNGKNYYIRKGKNIEQITEEQYKTLNKTTEETTIGREFNDPNNQYHNYKHGEVEPFAENISKDFSLVKRITLENPIVDPEYTVIPNIETLRDAQWYIGRVQGEWDNRTLMKTLYPIKLFIDSSNAPQGWIPEIRDVIQFYQDSLNIHPDSLIKENPTYTEPAFNNGYSAINIVYTDSTEIGQQYATLDIVISASNNAVIGGWIKINVPKITNTTDAGMVTARQIEKYILQSYNRIKDSRYLGNTSYNNLGTTTRPNNDEKKLIKMGRNSNKPLYINGIRP